VCYNLQSNTRGQNHLTYSIDSNYSDPFSCLLQSSRDKRWLHFLCQNQTRQPLCHKVQTTLTVLVSVQPKQNKYNNALLDCFIIRTGQCDEMWKMRWHPSELPNVCIHLCFNPDLNWESILGTFSIKQRMYHLIIIRTKVQIKTIPF
jgi:hypothetical protein